MTATPVRDAATVIVLRDAATEPAVLMGQRGAKAAFMPNKVVFPGGAVDAQDGSIPLASGLNPNCAARLAEDTSSVAPAALASAAIRELWEETGLILGRHSTWPSPPPPDWATFAETGHLPDASGLRFVFRAITPPGRPRRFDARFFVVDAARIAGDPDDFSHASDELSHLQWIPLQDVRRYDLPFITEIVLAEVTRQLPDLGAPAVVPFFQNDEEESLLRALGRA